MEWVVKGSDEPAVSSKPAKQYGVTLPPQAYLGEMEDDEKIEDKTEEEEAVASELKVSFNFKYQSNKPYVALLDD